MRIKILLTLALISACSFIGSISAAENPLVKEFRTFVETVEADGKNYTEKQWNEANGKFDVLVSKFKEKKDSLSKKEREVIHDMIGRYKAAVTNSGFDSAINGVTKTYNTVADATTDAFNETKSFFKGVFKKKK